MKHTLKERSIALAGLFQATSLVTQLAHTGSLAQPEFETLMRSLFITSPKDAEEDKTRYTINLLQLQRLLEKKPDVLNKVAEELQSMEQQLEHFEITHPNVTARLADIYLNNISTLGPRIMVSGENNYLENPDTANKVRSLLLAGIRAAVLWRQCGGSRWQLLFKRQAIVNEAESLLA
jgi:high frequency lysogenization protein